VRSKLTGLINQHNGTLKCLIIVEVTTEKVIKLCTSVAQHQVGQGPIAHQFHKYLYAFVISTF
jgi:hypothetical protein